MEWYYALNGTQLGPVTDDELRRLLREGTVKPEDFVWTQSFGNAWKRAKEVQELMPTATLPPAAAIAASRPVDPADETPPFTGVISCVDPVGISWASMKQSLFRPFDLGKWFTLGFSAWLATLTQQGGGSFGSVGNFGTSGTSSGGPLADFDAEALGNFLAKAWEQVAPFMVIAIPLLILVFGIGLFMLWVQCRGKFMFLDNIVNQRMEVKLPWTRFSQHARSLFLWSIGYSIACFVAFGACFGGIVLTVLVPIAKMRSFSPALILPIVVFSMLIVILLLVNGYIMRFLEDFVVPLMYRFDLTATEAWARFRQLSRGKMGKLLLYGLFYTLLAAGWGMGLAFIGVAACCIGLCLMMLPYVSAVYLLPMTMHLRMYSLEYLAQFGPEYRMQQDPDLQTLP